MGRISSLTGYDPDKKIVMTEEDIKRYRGYLEKAVPYTKEEIDAIPYDSWDYDLDRALAYDAQCLLKQAGLL